MSKRYVVREEEGSRVYTGEDSIEHVLYEGDNLHSLEMVQETHKNKVNVIYIDPPYNTGNTGFVYNDKFKITGDVDRHTSWLSFMEKRLRLARELMTDDGVIFISIDDNEMAQLKLLCDNVFGEQNFIETLILKSNNKGRFTNYFLKSHEYVFVYRKSENLGKLIGNIRTEEELKRKYTKKDNAGRYFQPIEWRKRGNNSKRENSPNCFYPIYLYEDGGIGLEEEGSVEVIYPKLSDGLDGCWRGTSETFLNRIERMYAHKKRNGEYNINERFYPDGDKDRKHMNSILADSDMSTESGSLALKRILGETVFDYPKSPILIKRLVELHPNPNAIVLDFFAGSGTTAQAVMELNKEDGGNRKTILMNSNEINTSEEEDFLVDKGYIEPFTGTRRGTKKHAKWLESVNDFKETEEYKELIETEEYKDLGVARRVTRERVRKVIEGYTTPKGKEVEGLDGNNFRHYVVSE